MTAVERERFKNQRQHTTEACAQLSRGDLADLAKMKAQATEMLKVKEQELITLKRETNAYMKIYLANKAEMQIG